MIVELPKFHGKRKSWQSFDLPISYDEFVTYRSLVDRKFGQYKERFPDWEIGFVPLTLFSVWIDQTWDGFHKITGLDRMILTYSFYMECRIEHYDGTKHKIKALV